MQSQDQLADFMLNFTCAHPILWMSAKKLQEWTQPSDPDVITSQPQCLKVDQSYIYTDQRRLTKTLLRNFLQLLFICMFWQYHVAPLVSCMKGMISMMIYTFSKRTVIVGVLWGVYIQGGLHMMSLMALVCNARSAIDYLLTLLWWRSRLLEGGSSLKRMESDFKSPENQPPGCRAGFTTQLLSAVAPSVGDIAHVQFLPASWQLTPAFSSLHLPPPLHSFFLYRANVCLASNVSNTHSQNLFLRMTLAHLPF